MELDEQVVIIVAIVTCGLCCCISCYKTIAKE